MPPPPSPGAGQAMDHIELKTTRRGTQHAVQISLEGADGKRVSRELLVDTGADFVVLPASLLSALGIGADRAFRGSDVVVDAVILFVLPFAIPAPHSPRALARASAKIRRKRTFMVSTRWLLVKP